MVQVTLATSVTVSLPPVRGTLVGTPNATAGPAYRGPVRTAASASAVIRFAMPSKMMPWNGKIAHQ
jgi:hypothetical protein